MDTDLLRNFCKVMESGTIASASTHLNMTPGALSRSMKRLEEELGLNLFKSSGRNILPTPEAKLFYGESQEILGRIDLARKRIQNNLTPSKRVALASFEVFTTHLLAKVINENIADSRFFLIEKTPSSIELAILEDKVQFGISYVPSPHPDLDHLKFGEMRFAIFGSKRFIGKKYSASELPFAIPATELDDQKMNATSLDGWPIKKQRKVQYQFDQLETAVQLASRGSCVLCAPEAVIRIHNERVKEQYQLHELTLIEPITFSKQSVYLIKKKTTEESAEIKKIIQSLRILLK
ncbi:MAG: LysR family transcriptional regulator [Xanthomonadaceae bacterium]|nr:LysR family transcriptional regulator [Xanthomonadaceae bacterium]